MNDRDRYIVRCRVILLFIIALYLCMAFIGIRVQQAYADWGVFRSYGECTTQNFIIGYYATHERILYQKFLWEGGYIDRIAFKVTSVVGSPTQIFWSIHEDVDGEPVDPPAYSGSFDMAATMPPAWYEIFIYGSMPPGDYWVQLYLNNVENGNYYTLSGSSTDCVASYGYIQCIDAVCAGGVAEIALRVYEDYLTPTATFVSGGGTDMPTLTPTITLTPTPILSIITTLESGAGVAIERTSTYGDRAIVIAICVLIVIMLVDVTTRIIYAKRNN